MGQKINKSKQVVTPDVEAFLNREYRSFQFVKLLNNGLMIKTALVVNEKDGTPLIVKLYFKTDPTESNTDYFKEMMSSLSNLSEQSQNLTSPKSMLNIAPLLKVENSEKAVLGIRQFFYYNLKERIYLMPYLTHIEKIWLTLQILFAVSELHSKGLIHGDIKLENILLSSYHSVFLSDIAPYKPTYIQMDDISSYQYYFGSNNDSVKACNLAPERILDKSEYDKLDKEQLRTPQMDVFSLGAIISELFLEQNLFDYSGLIAYKKGQLEVDTILSKLPNQNLIFLIKKMIELDPSKRISLSDAIDYFKTEICPIAITKCLFHFNVLMNIFNYWKPDMLIGAFYKHWNQIWKVLFGLKSDIPPLYQKLNFTIINKLIIKDSFNIFIDKGQFRNFDFIFDLEELSKLNNESELQKDDSIFTKNLNQDCLSIFINLILQAITNTKYESSNIVGMEMLKAFCEKVTDLTKMQLIIPYFVYMIQKENNLTRLTALHYLIETLYSINFKELILPSSDYNFFDSYIFPSILELHSSGDSTLILEFTSVIDKLIDLEEKFLNVALKSKLKKLDEMIEKQLNEKRQILNQNQNDSGIETEQKSENTINEINATINIGNSDTTDVDNKLREEKILIDKRNKRDEIFKSYDSQVEEFKDNLFTVIEDLMGKNDQIDIMQMLIRKMPSLLVFYGRKKTEDFSKFIINTFNKKEWNIQREILKFLPDMMLTLGETTYNYILICMESLINNNLNELKTFELVRSMFRLLKMDYITPNIACNLFKEVLHFIVHPNVWIRKEIIDFGVYLLSKLNELEIFSNLYEPMKNYLTIPAISLTPEILQNFVKHNLTRIIYNLELGEIDYNFNRNAEEEDAYNLLIQFLIIERKNLKTVDDDDDNNKENYNFNADFDQKLKNFNSTKQGLNLRIPLAKEYKAFAKKNKGEGNSAIDSSFFGKILWFSDTLANYSIPKINTNNDLLFKEDNTLISLDQFKIEYLFKMLGVSLKLQFLNEIVEENELNKLENMITSVNRKEKKYLKCSLTSNKSFINWRPQGQIITTLYDHDKISVEKLLPMEGNRFASFDSNGGAILWKVEDNKDNTFTFERKWSFIPTADKLKPVKYNKTLCTLDGASFLLASKGDLYNYSPQYETNLSSAVDNLYSNEENGDITCVLSVGESSQERQLIVFCNENGRLNIFDQRMRKVALSYDIPMEKGMVSCICGNGEDCNSIYLGTLGGYILNYDLRINNISNSYEYYSNNPIIGLKPYRLCKLKDYELSSNYGYSTHLIVWTGADDHEIALWNMSSLNCDMLFKVNTLYDNEIKPLTVELPCLIREEQKEQNIILEKNFTNLSKFTHKYNDNFAKSLILNNISGDFYTRSNKRLNKLLNLYDNLGTVQTVVSPLIDTGYENAPYFISAGNDKIIRYWDITKEGLNANDKKSYIVNSPCSMNKCVFSKSVYDNTILLQSNEFFNLKEKALRKDMPGFSEYQNYNGIAFHTTLQNEFEDTEGSSTNNLKYCTRISDASHKSIITDILPISIGVEGNPNTNLLISSSWDGTIKVWK